MSCPSFLGGFYVGLVVVGFFWIGRGVFFAAWFFFFFLVRGVSCFSFRGMEKKYLIYEDFFRSERYAGFEEPVTVWGFFFPVLREEQERYRTMGF